MDGRVRLNRDSERAPSYHAAPRQQFDHRASRRTDLVKVLITSATSGLGAIVAEALGKKHDVVLTDVSRSKRTTRGFKSHELGHDPSTDDLVRGLGAIVHVGYGGHEMEATPLLDYLTRCTYNPLTACLNTGVKRFVYLHSL